MKKLVLGPDVYVNASVAGGTAPEQVAKRVLQGNRFQVIASPWLLERVISMLEAHPDFRNEAIRAQVETIRQFVTVVDCGKHEPEQWQAALVATAKAANASRVVTDHPDLADVTIVDDIEFLSSEAWMIEDALPPPPPPKTSHRPSAARESTPPPA